MKVTPLESQPLTRASRGSLNPHLLPAVMVCSNLNEHYTSRSISLLIHLIPKDVNKVGKYIQYEIEK